MYYSMRTVVSFLGVKIYKGDNGRNTRYFIKIGNHHRRRLFRW